MPSLQDSAIIFILALLLFGPKKLPVLARELGKWIGEFRRASNEFKMQMEEELRVSEQAERQEKIAAMEAAAPPTPALEGVPSEEPEHPHLDRSSYAESRTYDTETVTADTETEPLPIATSGDLSIMPPSTGLPTPRSSSSAAASQEDLAPLLESIPTIETQPHHESPVESSTHG